MLQELENSTKVETQSITVTSSAVDAVKNILSERKLEGYSLRVYVAGSSCSGVSFGMALENNIRENDLTIRSGDIQIVVDDQSMAYLQGAKIDFVNDPVRGAGFTVDSPLNTGGCSCGSGEKSQSQSDGCGCGGSCSCSN